MSVSILPLHSTQHFTLNIKNCSSYSHDTWYIYRTIRLQQMHHTTCCPRPICYRSLSCVYGKKKYFRWYLLDEFILGQIAYPHIFSASMQTPMPLTFFPDPLILPYISSTIKCINIITHILDRYDAVTDLIIYRVLWPAFHGSLALTHFEHLVVTTWYTGLAWPHTIWKSMLPIFHGSAKLL